MPTAKRCRSRAARLVIPLQVGHAESPTSAERSRPTCAISSGRTCRPQSQSPHGSTKRRRADDRDSTQRAHRLQRSSSARPVVCLVSGGLGTSKVVVLAQAPRRGGAQPACAGARRDARPSPAPSRARRGPMRDCRMEAPGCRMTSVHESRSGWRRRRATSRTGWTESLPMPSRGGASTASTLTSVPQAAWRREPSRSPPLCERREPGAGPFPPLPIPYLVLRSRCHGASRL